MKLRTSLIGSGLVFSLVLQGCYTQLTWFYPSPEEEQDPFYETYSRANVRPNLDMYAQDLNSTSSLAYSMMHRRFDPLYSSYYGYSNFYNGYDPYSYYGGYRYGYSYTLGGYPMFIPVTGDKEIRGFTTDRTRTHGTNLNVVRTSNTNTSSRSSSGWSSGSSSGRSSSISSTRSTGGGSSSGSSSESSGGRRATRRN
ncbi:MAG: hypothetical protein QF842_03080 [Candidatus Marinimicrobia bacterium]|jgi:uncharacterized membrane protein YgcG|nr:hypothetical protein [Candidatus Neomarinimicrobiota bacterium]MDP6611842.1 hypothetical protein [Candidatus Neomarinimicrobiota bacterium]|tara:strand:- start:1953 stop:2543 length:591 start_codon:yes stop_codon:yes gene_type:complete